MIPVFTIDGLLPPFQGSDPGQQPAFLSPYEVTAFEVVERFGSTDNRREILRKWLEHRAALRGIGLDRGFQWLDGSFVENKEPKDIDLVSFVYRPLAAVDETQWRAFMNANSGLLQRNRIKQVFNLDAFFLDMDGDAETLVLISRYFLQLFSHQRSTYLWKGMLQVRMDDIQDDAAALLLLSSGSPEGVQP